MSTPEACERDLLCSPAQTLPTTLLTRQIRWGKMYITMCTIARVITELMPGSSYQDSWHVAPVGRPTSKKHTMNIVLVPVQVKVVKGQDSFLKYKSSDPLTRHMCDACGCHMFGKLEGDTPNIVSMRLSTHIRAIVALAGHPLSGTAILQLDTVQCLRMCSQRVHMAIQH